MLRIIDVMSRIIFMKKVMGLLECLLMAFLIACGKENKNLTAEIEK